MQDARHAYWSSLAELDLDAFRAIAGGWDAGTILAIGDRLRRFRNGEI